MPDNCKIYYESWQIQCCGEPFSVGDIVEWTCIKSKGKSNHHEIPVDFIEDHHAEGNLTIVGTITKITAERSETPHDNKPISYDEVELIREELQHADGWESDFDSDEETQRFFWGYIVELKDVTVNGKRFSSWKQD